jgi:NADH-quinone oxidoreductase subunit I
LATTVKNVHRNVTLSFLERMYIPYMLAGMWIAARHLAINMLGFFAEILSGRSSRKVMTVFYPEEQPVIPPAYRGRPVLVLRDDGLEKCVACGLCEAACPPKCIFIIGGEREDGERFPVTYTLDGSRCIFCGFCEEVCPHEAIVMSGDWKNLCEYDRAEMIYEKEDLLVPRKTLVRRIELLRSKYFSGERYR